MSIKYIGLTGKWEGKALFEILLNLKDLGKGRVVVRRTYEKYPEPSYFRISRAEPQMDQYNRHGQVWAHTVFRGRDFGVKPVKGILMSDWHLLSKEEEEAYYKGKPTLTEPRVLPKYVPFPPLLERLINRDRTAAGLPPDNNLKLEMKYVLPEDTYESRAVVTDDENALNVEFRDLDYYPKDSVIYKHVKFEDN